MKLNKKGEALIFIILFIAMLFGAMDSNNLVIFFLTKIIAILLLAIDFKLMQYLPEEFFEI